MEFLFYVWRFHGIWCWHQVPWNFQSSMEFHWTSLLTWKSSMEFHGTKSYFIWRQQSSMEYSMEFHWTKLYLIWRHQNSMEFHGIPWNLCVIWNGTLLIPWHPIELGNFVIWRPLVTCILWNSPWKSGETNVELISVTTSKFHGIPWN